MDFRELLLLGGWVNKGKNKGRGCWTPALASGCLRVVGARSFLALLLLFASQEVVRDPPY
jgi:hypothetical protein